jgi:hypothetical protein
MLAARITLAHFSVSSAINLPKSADEPASVVLPKSASRALILGSARPALISLSSLRFANPSPFHGVASLVFAMSRAQSSAGTRCEQTAKLNV